MKKYNWSKLLSSFLLIAFSLLLLYALHRHPPSPKKPSSTKIQPKKKVNRAEVVITRYDAYSISISFN